MANEIDWRSVKHEADPRNERRMLVEVDVVPVGGIGEFGQFIQSGKQRVLIYQSELAKLQRLTQTDEDRAEWASAERAFARALTKHTERIKDPQAKALAERTFGQSPASFYQDMHPDAAGVPPIRSYRVLVDDVPPPETPANLQANQMGDLAATLARLLTTMNQGQPKAAR